MVSQQGIDYVHAAKGPRLRAQVAEVGASVGKKWGYSKIAEMAAVKRKQNEDENLVPAGVCSAYSITE